MKHAELKNRTLSVPCLLVRSRFDQADGRRATITATPHSACPSAWAIQPKICKRSHIAPKLSVPGTKREDVDYPPPSLLSLLRGAKFTCTFHLHPLCSNCDRPAGRSWGHGGWGIPFYLLPTVQNFGERRGECVIAPHELGLCVYVCVRVWCAYVFVRARARAGPVPAFSLFLGSHPCVSELWNPAQGSDFYVIDIHVCMVRYGTVRYDLHSYE